MSIAEIWKEEGREEGRQEGRKEGRQEGRVKGREEGRRLNLIEMTTKALVLKFKDIPNEISEKIKESDPATLDEVVLKLINDEFKDIDEVREFL